MTTVQRQINADNFEHRAMEARNSGVIKAGGYEYAMTAERHRNYATLDIISYFIATAKDSDGKVVAASRSKYVSDAKTALVRKVETLAKKGELPNVNGVVPTLTLTDAIRSVFAKVKTYGITGLLNKQMATADQAVCRELVKAGYMESGIEQDGRSKYYFVAETPKKVLPVQE